MSEVFVCVKKNPYSVKLKLTVSCHLTNRIPRVHISADEEGGKEIELSDDPYDCMRLNVENMPCIVTLCKVSSHFKAHKNTNSET